VTNATARTGLPRVAVFALGGTIASAAGPGEAATVQLTGHDLVRALPQAAAVADLDVHTVATVPSGDLRLADVHELAARVGKAVQAGAHGVVVTQGTDTLEETSYAFDLLTAFDVPVVFTGAMRNASLPGPDGPANLLAAIGVAASPRARGLGTVVVFNDEIHGARHVRKRHTSSTAAFGSPLTGPLGHVTEGRVRILVRPSGRLRVHVPAGTADASVAQVVVSFDDDGRLIGAVPSLGYRGLVVAAFGGGHAPSRLVPILADVAGQIPVVLASRTNAGEVLTGSYAYPGSETDLISRGLIPGGSLDAAHAAVLLRLLLMAGVKPGDLPTWFERASDPQGLVTAP
jgi:L-asparaginase